MSNAHPSHEDSKSETRHVPTGQPAANQPGGPKGADLQYENGSRGSASGANLEQARAAGVPETPVDPAAAGQLPDAARD